MCLIFPSNKEYDIVSLVDNQIQSVEFGLLLLYMNNMRYNPILCSTHSFYEESQGRHLIMLCSPTQPIMFRKKMDDLLF